MAEQRRGGVGGMICGLWRGIESLVRAVAVIGFVVALVAVLMLLFGGGGPKIKDSTALVVSPRGVIVEQLSGDPMDRAIDKLLGTDVPETLIRDVTDSIEAAAEDDRISVLVLRLDSLSGAGLTKLQRIRRSVEQFKASGKTVIATASHYNRTSYYLASTADEIHMHPMGIFLVEGYSRYRTYYREGIDRLGVDWHVFRVGEYKSATEPYLRSGMSNEAKEANLDWLGDLWRQYLEDVSTARGLEIGLVSEFVENLTDRLQAANGSTAEAALAAGLVDKVAHGDVLRQQLIEIVGTDDDDEDTYRSVSMADYLESLGGDRPSLGGDEKSAVGVLVARGTILDGSQPPGTIGGDSTAALIRKARKNESLKALVLRVDSGGGSAFASEVIRRELELTRAEGLPVVVSMGSVAASGGYWISTSCDELWASPTTITGSIGIYGMFPTFHRPLAKHLGIYVDGVGTTRFAGGIRPDRELPPEIGDAIQRMIDRGYADFLERVAEARGTTPEEIDPIARGRVWSGEDAMRLGLIDNMGELEDAVAAAAQLAELGDDYEIKYLEKELGLTEKLLVELLSATAEISSSRSDGALGARPATDLVRMLAQQMHATLELNDPAGVYAHSFIETD